MYFTQKTTLVYSERRFEKGKTGSTWTDQGSISIALGRNDETKLLVGGLQEVGRLRKCYYAPPTPNPLPEKTELRN